MKIRFFPLIFLLLGIGVFSTACGKKAPPVPPPPSFTAAVRNVTARVGDGFVVLEGETYGKARDMESVSGCILHYAWYPPGEKPCQGCPLDYRPLKMVEAPVVGSDAFSCRVPWSGDKGFHFFRVSLVGPEGKTGPPSASVSIEAGV